MAVISSVDAQVEEASGSEEEAADNGAAGDKSSSLGFRVLDYHSLPEVLESPLPHLLVLYDDT